MSRTTARASLRPWGTHRASRTRKRPPTAIFVLERRQVAPLEGGRDQPEELPAFLVGEHVEDRPPDHLVRREGRRHAGRNEHVQAESVAPQAAGDVGKRRLDRTLQLVALHAPILRGPPFRDQGTEGGRDAHEQEFEQLQRHVTLPAGQLEERSMAARRGRGAPRREFPAGNGQPRHGDRHDGQHAERVHPPPAVPARVERRVAIGPRVRSPDPREQDAAERCDGGGREQRPHVPQARERRAEAQRRSTTTPRTASAVLPTAAGAIMPHS
jgi:hypothetical protein